MGHRFESCWAHQIIVSMNKTIIKSTESGIEQKCEILKKNDKYLEVILENTTIKIFLKKRNNIYVGNYKEIEFTSTGK